MESLRLNTFTPVALKTKMGHQNANHFKSKYKKANPWKLDDYIKMLIKRPIKIRNEIEIVAFSRGTEHILKSAQVLLDLRDKFDKRFLKPDLNWTTDIGATVQNFLRANTKPQKAYQIVMDAHSSIAFTVGRVFDSKSGVDICPIQKTNSGPEL